MPEGEVLTTVISGTHTIPSGEGTGPYVIPMATPSVEVDRQGAFKEALALLEGADAPSEAAPPATPAEEHPAAAAKPPPGTTTDGATPEGDKPPAADPVEDKFKAKFEQLRREGAKVDKEREALKADLEELARYRGQKAEAKLSLTKALEMVGMSQEEFTKLALTGGELSNEAKLALESKQEVASMRQELAARDAKEKERQEATLLDNYNREAANFVQSSTEHEFLKSMDNGGGAQMIMHEINAHYEKTFDPTLQAGETLSYQEAADRVEKQIEEHFKGKVLMLKKVQAMMGQGAKPVTQQTTTPAAKSQNGKATTLTGTMTAQTAPKGVLSEQERLSQALKMLDQAWTA
jgi:hypothetical protein